MLIPFLHLTQLCFGACVREGKGEDYILGVWKEAGMKRDDAEILREVQKNTEMAMKAIDTISDKVYDDDLAVQLSKQTLKYSEIHNKALDRIIGRESGANTAQTMSAR